MEFENNEINNENEQEILADETELQFYLNEEDISVQEEQKPKMNKVVKEIMDWVISIALAVIIALVIRTYVFTLVRVDGPSMNPTLTHGDTLYTHKLFYKPKVGDIIIFHPKSAPEKAYVKRIIATEGQHVHFDKLTYTVSVDGKVLDEPYIDGAITMPKSMGTDIVVPEGHVFVMGDNRINSTDSRDISVGCVSLESIEGRAVFRILPFQSAGVLK